MATTSIPRTEAAPADARLSRTTKSLTLAALSLGFGVVQLDVTIVNTALNNIGASLSGDVTDLQWVVSAYTMAFAAFILTAGALGDRLGAKRIFVAGFAIFTLMSLACALAPTAAFLIVARTVQGLGAAILVPNSLALLNHAYPSERERGRAVGIWAAGASLALTAGPPLGGFLAAFVGWRGIFLVNLPIGAIGLWLAWRYTTETRRTSGRELDLPGQFAAIGALGALAFAIIEGGGLGWTDHWVIAACLAALGFAVLFVLREARAEQPMLPLALFKSRLFSLLSLAGLFVNIAFYGLIFVLSLYFQRIRGYSPLATGLAFLPMMMMFLPVNLIAARLAERFGAPAVISGGAMIAAAGVIGLIGLDHDTNYWAMVAQLIALSAGLGLLVPPLTSALLGSVDKARSGIAAGVLNSTRQTGSLLGVALFGSLIGGANAFIAGTRTALIISFVLFLCVAGAILLVGRDASGRR